MGNEGGFALLGVFLVILMMTVLGVASLTFTGLENRMAGAGYDTNAGAAAAESCIGTGVNIIAQTLDPDFRQVPGAYVGAAAGVPANAESSSMPPTLTQEIMGQADNDPDSPAASPDIQILAGTGAGPFSVVGDIDRLYIRQKSGGSLQFAAGYEGTAQSTAGGGAEAYYQIDCTATLAATGATSRVRAVYACTAAPGDTCQRKI